MVKYSKSFVKIAVYLLINFIASLFNYIAFTISYVIVSSKSFGTYSGLQNGLADFHMKNAGIYGILVPVISAGIYYFLYKLINKHNENGIMLQKVNAYSIVPVILSAISFEYLLSYVININFVKITFDIGAGTDLIFETNAVLLVFSIGIVGPLFEEILFRGLIYGELLSCFHYRVAIFLQAALFSLWHFDLSKSMYTFVSGIIFGFLYHRYRSILVPIIMHAIMNLTGIIIKYNFHGILHGHIELVCIFVICFALSIYILLFKRYFQKDIRTLLKT